MKWYNGNTSLYGKTRVRSPAFLFFIREIKWVYNGRRTTQTNDILRRNYYDKICNIINDSNDNVYDGDR